MVGLDIGSRTIKIVELEKSGGGHSLVASGIVAINGVSASKLEDEKEIAALGQVIRKLHKEAGISSRDVAISLPEPLTFTRTIRFPMLTDNEIASAVKWEAEQYIPIPVAEAIIQHSILERNEKITPPEVTVLLVAAPRVLVEKYMQITQAAGLNVVAVETELMSLTRALAPADKTILLVDLGAGSTDIAIAKKGLLSFSRSIPIAGEAFTRAVSQGLGVSPQQAEEYKKTYGLTPGQLEGKVGNALNPVLNMITDEIKKAIHYYQTEEKGEAPSAIMISGGSSGMREIISTLTSLTGMEVLVANPFTSVVLDPTILKKLAPYAPLYAVSIGLAMREV